MRTRNLYLLSALTAACLGQTVHAVEIVVPTDFPTIQGAISAAAPGDSIRVLAGTYGELISFGGKAIRVFSDMGPGSTTIDGTGLDGSVVTFTGGEGRDSVLEGFTVRGGVGTLANGRKGGGIYGIDSSPVIRGNVIEDNTAIEGGGLYFGNLNSVPAPLIESNTIRDNRALQDSSETRGGGLCLKGSASVVRGNTFARNRAHSPGEGGGAYIGENGSHTLFEGNVLTGNSATISGGGLHLQESDDDIVRENLFTDNTVSFAVGTGGGIGGLFWCGLVERNVVSGGSAGIGGGMAFRFEWASTKVPRIRGNVVAKNDAYSGAGIYLFYVDAILEGNTIFGNQADFVGGGVAVEFGSAEIRHNILWNNSAPGGKEVTLVQGATADFSYSDVQGAQGSIDGVGGSYVWGPGMINADPMFVHSIGNDFSLQANSPCIDRGDLGTLETGRDVDGRPRLLDGLLDGVRVLDIGAHEFSSVEMIVNGNFTPGGQISVISFGTQGLQTYLFLGFAPAEIPVGSFGPLFIDVTMPLVILPWLPLPSIVNGMIPSDFPAPATLILQQLALNPSLQGNFSNDVTLLIQ